MIVPLRILNAVADLTRLYSIAFLVPIPFALAYEPWDGTLGLPTNVWVFLFTFLGVMLLWLPAHLITQHMRDDELSDHEAYLTVGIGWIVLSLFSMLPFILSGVLVNPIDAFFETMAGLTTTGATVIAADLDSVPRSIMLWRAFLQYIGGMGIVVLGVAVLARLTGGGMQLLQAEAPGPSVSRLRPKMAQTARILWGVYALISAIVLAVLFLILVAKGWGWTDALYDAIIHTMTGISTGGFSNHSTSIAYFDSLLIEVVLIVTMLIAASNFTLHWYSLHGDPKQLLRDPEWRVFMTGVAAVTALVIVILATAGTNIGEAIRGGTFTMVSLFSSTGYSTVDFDLWPDAAKLILFSAMFIGGTAGSTSGGLKVVRVLVLAVVMRRAFQKLTHPRAVIAIRLGKKPLKEDTVWVVLAFFFLFITMWMLGTLVLTSTDNHLSVVEAASASVSALANMGPGLGSVGPTHSYAGLLPTSKVIMTFLMWAGRLEIFAALLVFSPSSWRRRASRRSL